VTLSFIDEGQFLTVIQPVLPLHECADPTPAESAVEPFHSVADSTAANPATIESTIEPLHSAVDPTGSGAALTETSWLCVWV
jgi:hypothetical protein